MIVSNRTRVALVLALSSVGCALDPRPSQAGGAGAGEPDAAEALRLQASVASAASAASAGTDGVASPPNSGWLDLEDSPLYPWCGAVLVGEGLALTSATCAGYGGPLRFGLGIPGESRGVPVVDVQVAEADPRLAWLTLETPIASAPPAVSAPARTDAGADGDEGLPVVGVSMLFSPRGEASDRWTWRGTLRSGVHGLRVDLAPAEQADQSANCHGDNGSGVFNSDGQLVGIVVAASGSSQCVESLGLAPLPSMP